MNRRDLLQILCGVLANGTLERLGASAVTLALARSLSARAQEAPPASPQPPPPPPDASGPAPTAGPSPEPLPPPDASHAGDYDFGSFYDAASKAVTEATDAINADTHSVSGMPAPGSPLDLSAIGGVTAGVSLSGHSDAFGGAGSGSLGAAASFNPLTLDYSAEASWSYGQGKSTPTDPGGSLSVEASIGSGDLSGYNGPSTSTSASFDSAFTSFSTNATFAGISVGLSTAPSDIPGLSTETTVTNPVNVPGVGVVEVHGNLGVDAGQMVKSVTDSITSSATALMKVGDTVMSLVP